MIVAVSGNFYPLHDGHIDHFNEARKLGDYLVIIVGNDDHLKRKNKPVHLSLPSRAKTLEPFANCVVVALDSDGTVAETLRYIHPDIYAKGGSVVPGDIPQSEIDACKEMRCRIVCGVGRQLNHSSEILKEI